MLPQKKEDFTSKNSNLTDDAEMLDDYSKFLENGDFGQAVRGKYYQKYQSLQGRIPVTIKIQEGEKSVILHTVKAKAKVEADGKLVAEIPSNLLPGEYQVTIMIEEPKESTHE